MYIMNMYFFEQEFILTQHIRFTKGANSTLEDTSYD